VNRSIDLLRSQRRLVSLDEADEPAGFDEPTLDDELLASVSRLDPDRRAVVALHYWFDYTTPEIAEVLGIPVGTVASRLSRALHDLRLHLEAPNV
jgi:RNA polymerase sigma-70 factor (ECF subfamily)